LKKLKVAIYSGIIPSTTFIENLIHAVAAQGHEVFVTGVKKSEVNYTNHNIKVASIPSGKIALILNVLWQKLLLQTRDRDLFKKLKNIISSRVVNRGHPWLLWAKYLPVVLNQPEIFHVQWAKGVEEWMFLKDLVGTRIILSLRGTHITNSPLSDEMVASSYRRCFPVIDGFHAVSKEISAEAGQYGAKLEKIKVIYSAVDTEGIRKFVKNGRSKSNETLQLISVGRMHWIKGYHYALDAVRQLIDNGIRVHYTLIGWGNQEEVLFQVNDLNLNNHVTIVKKIPHKEVLNRMSNSDLLLLPSVEEGIANVVLEAMAIGLPVVSSNCGGMREVIHHGVNGFLFENRNTNDLVIKIEQWLKESETKKNSIVHQAKTDIQVNHSVEKLGTEMSTFYYSVFSKN